jgi:riboflavin biosynthesis pyrimidine reductase
MSGWVSAGGPQASPQRSEHPRLPTNQHGSLIAVRRLYPTYAENVDVVVAFAYPEIPFGGRWLRANMIAAVDGAATDARGSSRGLSGTADRRLLVALRGLSDVILAGATTVRREAYKRSRPRPEVVQWREAHGLAAAPRLAIVSASLDFDYRSELFQSEDGPRPIVITTADAPTLRLATMRELADVIVAGVGRVDLDVAVAALAERGLMRMLCEGGPNLLGQVADAGLIDELCVTFAPSLAASPNALPIMTWPRARREPVPLRLTDVFEDRGYLFTRYRPDLRTATIRG